MKYTEKKTNDHVPTAKDNLDKLWAFDFPPWANTWSDFCATCERGGKLVLCEGPCVGGYCLECLGLKKEPKDDPWYCQKCKALRQKREEIYELTGGKSSRFRPSTYKIKIWMDRDRDEKNEDPYDVYQMDKVLKAKCFYPDKKSKKSKSPKDGKSKSKKESKSKSKRKSRKRARAQMEIE